MRDKNDYGAGAVSKPARSAIVVRNPVPVNLRERVDPDYHESGRDDDEIVVGLQL